MVSVIVPDCQDGTFFQRCINSIKRQIYKDIEIIAIWSHGPDKLSSEMVDKNVVNADPGLAVKEACQAASGKFVYFLSYFSVMASNCLEELVIEEGNTETIFVTNEVFLGDKNGLTIDSPFYELYGILFDTELLSSCLEVHVETYCFNFFYAVEKYKSNYLNVEKKPKALIYSTRYIDMISPKPLVFDARAFDATLGIISNLQDAKNQEKIENYLIDHIPPSESNYPILSDLVWKYRNDSMKLVSHYVMAYYKGLYESALKNKSIGEYQIVKTFAETLGDEPVFLNMFMSNLQLSTEMLSALKRLELHNYIYVVDNNCLYINFIYPCGVQNLVGQELADFVVSGYAEGRLGIKTILRSFIAWVKYKKSR